MNHKRARLALRICAAVFASTLPGILAAQASAPQASAPQASAPQAKSGGEVPVLAELFTSEGCSSCPPADALLMKLDRLQPVRGAHIVVLSEHVDYWNSLGWRDPFSSAQFSRRQAEYARLLGSDVYTPQLVIDGSVQLNGSGAKEIQAAIARAAARPKLPVRIVEATRDGAGVAVRLSVPPLPHGRAEVWIALADESGQSSVSKGENSGRQLAHVAVVRSLAKIGSVNRSGGFEQTVRLPLHPDNPGGSRIVAFVAQPNSPVLGIGFAPLLPAPGTP